MLDRAGTPLLAWQAGGAQPVDATLAPLLTPAIARVAAEQHGSGGWHLALVDAAGTVVERLTEPEGEQGKPLTSTLSVATQKAAQAAVTPRLWQDLPTTVNVGYEAPPRAVLGQMRAMMREVVTGGTATTLAGQGAVFGKTGTQAHGWFTGYRGDLAFAVLVLSGESSAPALSVAKSFLGA